MLLARAEGGEQRTGVSAGGWSDPHTMKQELETTEQRNSTAPARTSNSRVCQHTLAHARPRSPSHGRPPDFTSEPEDARPGDAQTSVGPHRTEEARPRAHPWGQGSSPTTQR